ncbi:MAG: ribosome silencing factor [Deltaproteobacteria bacterium GWA2_54_12]|nr:MAG: ribosome silencing factor [Deltaproteobacteria bacterium GWA2_54_12]
MQLEPKKKALEIAKLALDKKAEKVVILNIKKLSGVSDFLLVCSAESERQVQAIADSIEDGLRKKGERPFGMEGVTEGRWALIDYVDVVVHIFLEPVRSFYDLEGFWAEAPVTEVKDKPAPKPKAAPEKAKPAAAKAAKKPAAKAVAAKAAKNPAVVKALKKPVAVKAVKKTVAAKAVRKPAAAAAVPRKKKKSE